jgi:hypothetical protein
MLDIEATAIGNHQTAKRLTVEKTDCVSCCFISE